MKNRDNILIQPEHQIGTNFLAKFSFSCLVALMGFTALHPSLAALSSTVLNHLNQF